MGLIERTPNAYAFDWKESVLIEGKAFINGIGMDIHIPGKGEAGKKLNPGFCILHWLEDVDEVLGQ